jgi:type IV pilus biogenesis protein CpaD/CtpE
MRLLSLTAVMVLSLGVSACVQPQPHIHAEFGMAVRQDAAAQITDPDAVYRTPRTADGPRVALATDRYQTGKVVQPQATSTRVGPALGASTGP